MTNTMAHELAHSWAALHPEVQERFSLVINCIDDGNGYKFMKGNEPLMGYGKTNCAEAWATSADIYSDPEKACRMKHERPDQYTFFLEDPTSPFKGLEYCEK